MVIASSATTTTTPAATTMTTTTALSPSHMAILETICDYPTLLHHEETIARTPYDLKAWWLYLDEIDTLLQDQKQKQSSSRSSSNNNTTGGGAAANALTQTRTTTTLKLENVRDLIGKRSVSSLPGSYKLWKHHWEFILSNRFANNRITYEEVFMCFETALRTLHTFPRVWIEYIQFVLSLSYEFLKLPPSIIITKTTTAAAAAATTASTQNQEDNNSTTMTISKTTFLRRLANRALQSLAVQQHEDKLWPVLLECWKEDDDLKDLLLELDDDDDDENNNDPTVQQLRVETRGRILKRYCQLQPTYRQELCEYYKRHEKWGEAALLYQEMIQKSTSGGEASSMTTHQHHHQWWNSLADLCCEHPLEVEEAGVPWEAMVRAAVAMGNNNHNNNANNSNTTTTVLQEMQGMLWSKLADSWIRRGEFDLARSVLEEGMESVSRVRDFTILFDAYLQFEEGLLEAATEQLEEEEDGAQDQEEEEEAIDEEDWDILLGNSTAGADDNNNNNIKPKQSMADMELALARAEYLTSRRPILLNRVLLRQNPNNVGEWVQRSSLYLKQGEPIMAASALEEALRTVVASKANNGTPSTIVLELAKLYEENYSVTKARDLFDRICNQYEYKFRNADDLAESVAAWAELELRQESWDDALGIVRSALLSSTRQQQQQRGGGRGGSAASTNLTKSARLWDLLLDLEESLGSVQTTKDAYNRAMEIKVATPMHVLNFCSFLKDQKYFEESFSAFERGIELFAFPHPGAKLIWKAYIEAFLKRYKGTKVERARDMFQRCLETCPPEESAEFFMKSGEFEEEFGLTKRALSVYSAMCQKVPKDEKFTAYQLYIVKTTKYLGLTATRDIYQEAIEALEDTPAAQLCQDFAKMETTLQEIERARAVLTYGAQMADPRRNPEYWKTWNEFEIAHGNEETFREMLRIKRSVESAFSTVNYNAAEMSAGSKIGNLSNEEAMNMIASREGMEVGDQQTNKAAPISGFVKSSKRVAEVADLDQVEERVAKLRKATASSVPAGGGNDTAEGGDDDDEEIDIDDVDDEEEEDDEAEDEKKPTSSGAVKNVTTKAVPTAVFGGLSADAGKEASDKKGALARLREAASSGK